MPTCLKSGAHPLLLSCFGLLLAITTTAASTAQDGTPVDISEVLDAVHGKMYNFQFKSLEAVIFTDSPATCLIIQFLYSEEEANSFAEVWIYFKTNDGKRHVDTIPLRFTEETGKELRFEIPESSKNGHMFKEAAFQAFQYSNCYILKASLNTECFIIVLPTSSSISRANECVPQAELVKCKYENYQVSEDLKCLEYEEVHAVPEAPEVPNSAPNVVNEANAQSSSDSSSDNMPLDERHYLLQRYQDFPRGLSYSTLQLVYSSLEDDPSRICMFTYRPNENPPEHGKLHMLTTYHNQKDFIIHDFYPKPADGRDPAYKTRARIYRNGKFYETWVIFTDRKRCTILRTPGYNDLCELFTAGHRTSGSLNNYCFFIYTMYCKEPAKKFTSLGDCWPPARQPNP
uniref:Putative salivary lipocalin n=2 Tax=Ixodes ricinus TaxID=34613 RepID=A0A6B0VBL0_IXORI